MNKKLEFYDLKKRKSFRTENYTVKTVRGRKAAVAKAPSGATSYRFLPSNFKR